MLVTLAIIGVVAALTIPSLISKVQEMQYHSAFKKTYSELSDAILRLKEDKGGIIANAYAGTTQAFSESFRSDLRSYIKTLDEGSTRCDWDTDYCWAQKIYHLSGTQYINWPLGTYPTQAAGMIMQNGTYIAIRLIDTTCATLHWGATVPICGSIYIDVNGSKAPNTWGKDLYVVDLTKNGILPHGNITGTANTVDDNCSRTDISINPSVTCGEYVLLNKDY